MRREHAQHRMRSIPVTVYIAVATVLQSRSQRHASPAESRAHEPAW
jgi:hypothetical protein